MEMKVAATHKDQSYLPTQLPLAEEVPAFIPVLSGCLEFLHTLPALRYVAAGVLLIEQGHAVRTVHLVQSGMVKLVHLNSCGREATTGLRSEGWYAGSASVLLNSPSIYSVRTVTDCMVARIPAAEFSRCLKQNPRMLEHFLAALCLEVSSQASLQIQVMSSSAEDRLEHFLRERKTRHPSRKTMDPMPLLKQMELAQLLSITPEHLSRLMHRKRDASLRLVGAKGQTAAGKIQAKAS